MKRQSLEQRMSHTTILTAATALLAAGLLMPAAGAVAAPLFEESFDYPTGELNAVSSGAWSATLLKDNNSSGNPPRFDVGSGSLNFERNGNAVVTSGNTAASFVPDGGDDLAYSRSLGQTFNSGTVWFGWLQVNSPGDNQDTFLMLGDSGANAVRDKTNNTFAQIIFGRNSSSSDNLAYGTAADTNSNLVDTGVNGVTAAQANANAPAAQANFMVVAVDFDNNLADFYVNPDPLDISDNDFSTTGVTFGGSAISHVSMFRENDIFSGDFSGFFDEIRVGDSFLDVTGIPEPTSVALVGLGSLALLRRRRAN